MGTPVSNFGLVTVSTAYGAGDTSIILTTGHGAKLPATTGGYQYPLTWWNVTDYAHPADDPNVEIVLVTSRSSDTLTVTRAQESTSASTKNTGGKTYRMSLGITKAMWDNLYLATNTHQGLILQTDRDADTEDRQVEIAGLDYLIMDDGTVMSNSDGSWTGKFADITASGAGGLDTGSEVGGQWYDIYAIATETGTKNIILHKSKSWSDEASNTINEDASQNIGSSSSNQYVSQGFKCSSSGKLRYAQMKLAKVGTPTGQVWAMVYSDNAGVPGSLLALSQYIDISKIPTTATWIHFVFRDNAPTLSASPTQYHLVIGVPVSASNYLQWRMDGSAATYTGGSKALYNGTSWTADTDDDMMFVIGLETNNSSVTMPSTYTKKCHLGWVYNDGSSNFSKFIQHGKTRRSTRILEADNYMIVLNGTVQVARLLSPPIESCSALMACAGTGTQAGLAAIGDLASWDLSSDGDTNNAQAILFSNTTTTRPGVFVNVIANDGFLVAHGTSGAKLWMSGFSW